MLQGNAVCSFHMLTLGLFPLPLVVFSSPDFFFFSILFSFDDFFFFFKVFAFVRGALL